MVFLYNLHRSSRYKNRGIVIFSINFSGSGDLDLKRQTHEQNLRINELEVLRTTQQFNQLILDNTHDLITIHKLADLSYEYVNPAVIKTLGYSQEELFGKSPLELIHPDDISRIMKKLKEVLPKGEGRDELRYCKKDGTYAWLEVSITILPRENDETAMIIISREVTDRKQAERALQHQVESLALLLEISKNFANIMVDNIDEMIDTTLKMIGQFDNNDRSYICIFSDEQYIISKVHEWCAEGIDAEVANIQGLPVSVLPWWNRKFQDFEHIYIPRMIDLPRTAEAEQENLPTPSAQSLIIVPIFLEDKIIGFMGFDSARQEKMWSKENIIILETVAQIIAKALRRKKSAQALRATQNYYQTIFENTGAATMIIEENMNIAMVNEEYQRLLGYDKDDLIGIKWTDLIPADGVEAMKEYHQMRQIDPSAVPHKFKTLLLDKQGKYRDGLFAVDIIPGTNMSVATFVDFTEFNRIDRALKAISAVTVAMIHAVNEEELLKTVCQKIVEVGGYSLAWVGYVRTDPQQKVQPMAYAGINNAYLAKLNINLLDPKRGQGPTGTAIRTGIPVVSREFKKDDTFKPWLKDALRRGFKSSMDIPLMADNKAFGVLSIYSSDADVFDNEEQKLLLDMGNNLAYAINSLQARLEGNQTAQKLEKSLEKMQRILMQAVTSLGTALDIKDPYTAGHQKKVGRLAIAIAEEMGLSKDQIEGISVAGNLHDIGKIYVPSEILSKPGKLSDLEFAMIKTHCQAGYEIIKEIEFPWPVAEVLLQHHERMNGSGYPRGLAGDELLLEARIMAVADVVEAMASHRPYRPALGIDTALDEILSNRGILYDPDVVDACLLLFREKGFKLK